MHDQRVADGRVVARQPFSLLHLQRRDEVHGGPDSHLGVRGRFLHWVAPYSGGERYSAIYYQTAGEPVAKTTAVFAGEPVVPDDPRTFCSAEDSYHARYCRTTRTYRPSA